MRLIVGLGNPGPGYSGNRHNIGQMVATELAGKVGGTFRRHKSGARLLEGRLAGQRVGLVIPGSYMNVSGPPVAALARFFKLTAEEVIVLHDELDLVFGAVRLKQGGGEGGHNGLRSLSSTLGSKDYLRVRCGVGRPPGRMDPARYVLSDFAGAERKELPLFLAEAADATEQLLAHGLTQAQNSVHASGPDAS